MKKTMILLTAASLTAVLLTGCGGKSSETPQTQPETTVLQIQSETTMAQIQAETAAAQTQAETTAPQTQAETAAAKSQAETAAPTAQLANPWVDTDAAGIMSMTGLEFKVPAGVTGVGYRVLESEKLAEMNFTLQSGEKCTARAKATGSLEDISGMYYKWEHTETAEVSGTSFNLMQAEDGKVQLCNWFEPVAGISHSLSVTSDHDMNGFDITALALQTFSPAQGDVSGDTQPEGELVSKDFSQLAGTYTRTDDGSTLVIGKDGKVQIDIIRLTSMEGTANGIYKGIVSITVTDAAGEKMGLEFLPETRELIVVDSTWNYLPNGETIIFNEKK